jgi:hypothetical protein
MASLQSACNTTPRCPSEQHTQCSDPQPILAFLGAEGPTLAELLMIAAALSLESLAPSAADSGSTEAGAGAAGDGEAAAALSACTHKMF